MDSTGGPLKALFCYMLPFPGAADGAWTWTWTWSCWSLGLFLISPTILGRDDKRGKKSSLCSVGSCFAGSGEGTSSWRDVCLTSDLSNKAQGSKYSLVFCFRADLDFIDLRRCVVEVYSVPCMRYATFSPWEADMSAWVVINHEFSLFWQIRQVRMCKATMC